LRALPILAAGLGAASCAMPWPARARSCPIHQDARHSNVRQCHQYQTVEQVFTQKVRLEFQSSRRYTVVPSEDGVDGVVRGEIESISLSRSASTRNSWPRESRVTVV
jgi:hypothetical protein